jgi:hypothetical protein
MEYHPFYAVRPILPGTGGPITCTETLDPGSGHFRAFSEGPGIWHRSHAGIAVRNLRYFGSEPWPFPDSLMIGFVTDHAGGDIRVDNQEIEAASWFTRDTLPPIPSKASICGHSSRPGSDGRSEIVFLT